MPMIDDRGRIFGRLNIFDLFVLLLSMTAGVVAYFWLTGPERIASPFPKNANTVWREVDLYVPGDRAWLVRYLEPGMTERDPRSGDTVVELLSHRVRADGEGVVLTIRLRALRDGRGRLLAHGGPLLPGRRMQINFASAVVEGHVYEIREPGAK